MSTNDDDPDYIDASGEITRRDRARQWFSGNPEWVMVGTFALAGIVVLFLLWGKSAGVDRWTIVGTLFTTWALFLALLIWWATALDVSKLSNQLSRVEATLSDEASSQEIRARLPYMDSEAAGALVESLREADGTILADALATALHSYLDRSGPIDDPGQLPDEGETSPAVETTGRGVDPFIVNALQTTTGVSRENIAKGVWFEGQGNRPWYIRTNDGRRYVVALDKTKRAKTIQRLRNEEPDPPFG